MSVATSVRFDGQLVVLTGVARPGQVGEVVARAFGERGAALALIDRDGATARARADELMASGIAATGYGCDLTDAEALGVTASAMASGQPRGVSAVVCLAGGFSAFGPVAESVPETWQRLMAINLTSAYLTTRAFLPHLRRARGNLLYFASAAVAPGGVVADMAAYAAAKAGVVTLMRAVAAEEKANGVRANALAPTAINTGANVAAMGASSAFVERATVAEWATFLCSDACGPVSGQLIQLG